MKGLGGILAAIGVIVVIVGLLNHYVLHLLAGVKNGSTYLIVAGAVVLVVGVVLYLLPRKASA